VESYRSPGRGEAAGESADRPAVSGPSLETYVGQYEVVPGVELKVIAKDGCLLLQAPGQGAVPMTRDESDTFSIRMAGAQVVFHRDEGGAISHLVLHPAGQETRATRLSGKEDGREGS